LSFSTTSTTVVILSSGFRFTPSPVSILRNVSLTTVVKKEDKGATVAKQTQLIHNKMEHIIYRTVNYNTKIEDDIQRFVQPINNFKNHDYDASKIIDTSKIIKNI
jgi:hypothetical protein